MTEYLNKTHKVLVLAGDYLEDPESWGRSWEISDPFKYTIETAIEAACLDVGLTIDHADCICTHFRTYVPVVCRCPIDDADDAEPDDYIECYCAQYDLGNGDMSSFNDDADVDHDMIKDFIFDLCWSVDADDSSVYSDLDITESE